MPSVDVEQLRNTDSKASFPELLRRLASDGVRWADAELDLVRAEGGNLLRRCASGIAMALASFAALIAALVALAQACVIALAPYVNGQISAGFAVGLVLLGAVVLLAFAARRSLTRKTPPASLIFRWLAGADRRERAPR